jgi:hypothetical protein
MHFLPLTLESGQLHARDFLLSPLPQKKSPVPPKQETRGGGSNRTRLNILEKRKISCLSLSLSLSLGNQPKFSRSARSQVTISTELSPLIKLFYLWIYIKIYGRNSEHSLCSCNIITRLRRVYSVVTPTPPASGAATQRGSWPPHS